MGKTGAKTFRARLGGRDGGDIPLIEVPFDVKAAFGKARPPVVITVNGGFSFRSRVAVYGGQSYVGIRSDYREAAKVKIGQMVEITLAPDTAPRVVKVPKELAAALKGDPAAAAGWEKLSYTHRKEHAQAIEEAKKPETKQKRIAQALKMLSARK